MFRPVLNALRAVPAVFFSIVLAIVLSEVVAKQILANWAPTRSGFYMLDYDDAQLRALYGTGDPAERRAMLRDLWHDGVPLSYAPYVEFITTPRAGRFVNVTPDGDRWGSRLPIPTGAKLAHFYGGSTTFGMGVVDAETIPARFELASIERGLPMRTRNFAVNFHQSSQARILFQQHLIKGMRPDLAVFVEGLNDFVFCGPEDDTFLSPALAQADGRAPPLAQFVAQRSNIVQLAIRFADPPVPRPGRECQSDADIAAVVAQMDNSRRMTAAIAAAYGVKVLFVLQPIPGYAYDNSRRPVPISDVSAAIHTGSARGYPFILAARDSGKFYAQDSLWLERESIDANMYVDYVHYSPAFADHLAKKIADAAASRFKP